MAISDFCSFFTPKNQNFDFSKINTYEIKIFEDIQKTGMYSIELYTNYQCTKFQANIFNSGCAMGQNQLKVMTSLFESHFLHFSLSHVKTNDIFWNPEKKLDNIGMF